MRGILKIIVLLIFFVSPLSAQELPGTLQQIDKSGTINIGYRLSQPPMSSVGKDGLPEGYSIDICKNIVTGIQKKIGKDITVKYVAVTAEERFKALADNKIDILCGSTTATLSRRELVDFTQLTFVTGASFLSKKGTNLKNNFGGKKIGVVEGTTTIAALKELFAETETQADIIVLSSAEEGLKAIGKNEIDAFAADQVVLIGLALATGEPKNYSILSDLFTYEPFALAVRKNDAAFRLVADRVISDIYRSNEIRKIYSKWFSDFSKKVPSALEAMIQLNTIPE